MAKYYLHIQNAHGHAEDEEGVEVASLAEAQELAVTGIRSLLSAEVMNGTMNLKGRIDIADEQGTILVTVPFKDAIKVPGP
jgi:hypothetical protein